jgi:hypothetical protein
MVCIHAGHFSQNPRRDEHLVFLVRSTAVTKRNIGCHAGLFRCHILAINLVECYTRPRFGSLRVGHSKPALRADSHIILLLLQPLLKRGHPTLATLLANPRVDTRLQGLK